MSGVHRSQLAFAALLWHFAALRGEAERARCYVLSASEPVRLGDGPRLALRAALRSKAEWARCWARGVFIPRLTADGANSWVA